MEWISVKDRLPPLDIDVLVSGHASGRISVSLGGLISPLLFGKPRLWSSWNRIRPKNITHWKPLDAPLEADHGD